MLAYHVTRLEDLGSIMEKGLVPAIGPRSEILGEEAPAVYLFTSCENMDTALSSWLGEVFDDEDAAEGRAIERVALEVELEDEYFISPDEFYEIAYPNVIEPSRLRVVEDYEV